MFMIKKIGVMCAVLGLIGLLGPSIGIVLRGMNAQDSRLGGAFLLGFGLLVLGIGFLAEYLQTSVQKSRQAQRHAQSKPPDDVIR